MANEELEQLKESKKSSKDANVIFCRKVESKGEMIPAEPPAFIVFPVGEKVMLPSPEQQLKGFYHERAAEIIRSQPKSYKEFKAKGAK